MAQFQSFEDESAGSESAARVEALRAELKGLGLDGFVIPRADQHQGEYPPPSEERLAWLTGFTGSAGIAVVLADAAAIFVDGRYTVQAAEQVDAQVFEKVAIADVTPEDWIAAHLPRGGRLGFDPWLTTSEGRGKLERAAHKAGAALAPVDRNPIDRLWRDRPKPPLAPVFAHDLSFAGEETGAKLKRVRDALAKEGCDALIISDPHALCWLFNIRGGDVRHTPLILGYGLIRREGESTLFIDGRKLDDGMRATLGAHARLCEPDRLAHEIGEVAGAGARVRIDKGTGAAQLSSVVEAAGGAADIGPDPIGRMKARKNEAEIAGARAAQRRDGAAMARFLAWLSQEAPRGALSEIDAAEKLEEFRRDTNLLHDLSFPTISAAGPNAALPHYRVSRRSNRRIEQGLYLVDSGGQYRDGTTDITRTVAVGEVADEMKDRYTRVLRGHIAIATVVFPQGATGAQLDALARLPLWSAGLDFDHGVGHGVGAFLSVHEGPQRISKLGHARLEPGMILSNEPGYYKTGGFGVRIENLVLVERRDIPGADREMLGFETISFAPIDLAPVLPEMMRPDEIAWLNAYHERVRERLAPLVDAKTASWLERATRPLALSYGA